jgi:hypothetical protein
MKITTNIVMNQATIVMSKASYLKGERCVSS